MAKFLFGATLTAARGSIGSVVFTQNAFGGNLRMSAAPHNPRTIDQTRIRATTAALARAWSGVLTDLQRSAWIALAATVNRTDALGQNYKQTGFTLYISANQNLALLGLPRIDAAPASYTATSPLSLTVAYAAGPPTLTFTAGAAPAANECPMLYASKLLRAGNRSSLSALRALVSQPAGDAGPWEVSTEYLAKFGPFIPGRAITCQLRFIRNDTGAPGAAAVAQVLVT